MSIAVHIRGTSVTVGSSLNCDDLPEVRVWPLNLKSHSRASRKVKTRRNRVDLPVVSETPHEDSDAEISQEQPQTWWQCQACTFQNVSLLPCCEVCEVTRGKAGAMYTQGTAENTSKALLIASTPCLDWPALPETLHEAAESWIDCEVSSVASSWLDIGFAVDEQIGDADEADVVLINGSTDGKPLKPTGALLWSSIVGCAPALAAHRFAAVIMPPLSRKDAVRTRNPAVDEDERDIDLDELDARRMMGTRWKRVKRKQQR